MTAAIIIGQAELRVRCAGADIDVRLFSKGGGPGAVFMPTPHGFTVPATMLPQLIARLQSAEQAARAASVIGGGN